MVRGIGKKKGGKLALLEPLSRVFVSYNYRERYDVQTALSLQNRTGNSTRIDHPIKASIHLFLAEMLVKSLKEEAADQDLFDFIDSSLEYFYSTQEFSRFHSIFLLKLTRFFGFYPASSEGEYFDLLGGKFTSNKNKSLHTLDAGETALLKQLMAADYDSELKQSSADNRRALIFLVDYYKLHLEGFGEVKSLPILIDVFSD